MTILKLEDIRGLRLERTTKYYFSDSKNRNVQKFDKIESALDEQIKEIASEKGIEAKLPYYLAYLYHCELMDFKGIEEHIVPLVREDNPISYSLISGWFKKLRIPIRDRSEAKRIQFGNLE